jgi:post-segregation antitoxin (ccd killing protein)
MARLNVYLPDELARQARAAGLHISSLAQDAVRRSLSARSTDHWLEQLASREPSGVSHDRVIEALDQVRDEPPTRHG